MVYVSGYALTKLMEKVPITVSSGNVKLYPRIDMAKYCFCALCEEFCPTKALKLTPKLPPPNT